MAKQEAYQGEYVVGAAIEAMITHYPGLVDLHQVIPEIPSPDSVHRQVEYQDLASLKQRRILALLTC